MYFFTLMKFSIKPISESKCPELLANYCDLLLRKTALTKKFTSEEIDEKLNNVVSIFAISLLNYRKGLTKH